MSENLPTSDVGAIAKAIEKSAEFGTQALQTSEKAGGFVARVFKEPIEHAAGIVSDRIWLARLRRLDAIADEVDDIHKRRGVTNTRFVQHKLGLPLLERAALEDEPELQKLWSNLLANAMDPSFTEEIRAAYSEILASLSAIDARILQLMYSSLVCDGCAGFDRAPHAPFYARRIQSALKLSPEQYALSMNNLFRLQCVSPYFRMVQFKGGIAPSGRDQHLSAYSGWDQVVMTPLGIRFVEACTDGVERGTETVRVGVTHVATIELGMLVQ